MQVNKFEYVSKSDRHFDLPTRGTKHSAGYDFHSPIDCVIKPNETIKFSLEVKCSIKDNEFLAIVPRSSIGFKYFTLLCNTIGIIDSDYYNNEDNEGEIFVKLHNFGDKPLEIHTNDRICQGIFIKYDIVEDDDVTNERTSGIGSTGK